LARSAGRESPQPAITWRSLVIALVLMPVCAFWTAYRKGDVFLSLLVPPTVLVFFLALVQPLFRRFVPRLALSKADLGAVYAYLAVGTGLASEWMYPMTPLMSWWTLHAPDHNQLYDNVASYLPHWLRVTNPKVLKGFMEGGAVEGLYTTGRLGVWVVKFLPWCGFISAMTVVMLCLNVIFREEWTRRERLSFPILQVPLAIVGAGERQHTLKSKALWYGFALAFLLDIYIGLGRFVPALPTPNLRTVNITDWFATKPLNTMGFVPLSFYPFIVALTFFLPLDLSFSCWFFFVLRKSEQVLVVLWGEPGGTFEGMLQAAQPPFLTQQSLGAWLVLLVIFLWLAREHLQHVWERLKGRGKAGESFVSYRVAAVVGLVAFLALLGWAYALQLPLPFMAVYFAFFIGLSLAVTRMRAELGPPTHEMAFMTVNTLMLNTVGTRFLNERMSAILPTFVFMNRTYRSHPMPQQLEGMKLEEETHSLHWRLFAGMIVITVAGLIFALVAYLHRDYQLGLATRADWLGYEVTYIIRNWRSSPKGTNWLALPFIGLGALVTILLALARWRFTWWPFHPAGYALAMNFGLDYYWFAMFLAWLIKKIVLRFGGLRLYRRTLPFMIGIILGEYTAGAFWSWLEILTRLHTYSFSIN